MYLLDTNICIALMQDNPLPKLIFTEKSINCYINTIILSELYKGVYCSQQISKNLTNLQRFLTLVAIVDFDQSAALEFGKIQGELRQIGKPTSTVDAMIAAVARSRQDILVTDNTKDFINILNLQLENWL